MSAVLFVEGGAQGADSKGSQARCREAFRKVLEGCGFDVRSLGLKVVSCGSRNGAMKDFETEMRKPQHTHALLLIDSEDPVANICEPLNHLRDRDKWIPAAELQITDSLIFLMTTSMETWIAADPSNLRKHFPREFVKTALPLLPGIELKGRVGMLEALKRATAGKYEKGDVSFKLLASVDVDQLRRLPSFKRMEEKLRKRFFGS